MFIYFWNIDVFKGKLPTGNPFYIRYFLINGVAKQADTFLAVQRMKVETEKSDVQ